MRSRRARRSVRQLAAASAIAAAGLVWRLAPLGLPRFWLRYGGAGLWGAMVLLVVAALRSRAGFAWTTPLAAAAVALAAELIRLLHTPALDFFRLTLPGALLLGRVFSPWNVLAYWLGILAAAPLYAATLAGGGAAPRPAARP